MNTLYYRGKEIGFCTISFCAAFLVLVCKNLEIVLGSTTSTIGSLVILMATLTLIGLLIEARSKFYSHDNRMFLLLVMAANVLVYTPIFLEWDVHIEFAIRALGILLFLPAVYIMQKDWIV